MAGNKVTIRLTEDQQSQIKKATGRSITELNIDVAATGQLTDKDLADVGGGSNKIYLDNM
jgi:type IV secretory pathway VirD2 relaxase